MNDSISRNAAINEVKRLHDVAWANWGKTRISANTMIDALEDLPSAQPKIIRCKDCKYAAPNGVYGCRLERFSCSDDSVRMYGEDFCSRAERKDNDS